MQTTFLTEDQIWGGSALDVIKKYGTKTALTDLAIALGGYMGSGSTTSEGDKALPSGLRPLMILSFASCVATGTRAA